MRLQCKRCQWVAPEDARLEAVHLHVQVEHDTDEVALDLVAVCSCSPAMTVTSSRTTIGGLRDYLKCGACGNTGHIIRRDT